MPEGSSAALTPSHRAALDLLEEARVPLMVGGAFALGHYTGIVRNTKDLDLFLLAEDARRAVEAARRGGFAATVNAPHWLSKIILDDGFVDLIHGSGNGLARVDATWFEHAERGTLGGRELLMIPVEEMIWSKSFVMERHRFDGADVAHLLWARSSRLDWRRLVDRFAEHWPVLLSHLLLFGYIYPAERKGVPLWVLRELAERIEGDRGAPGPQRPVCRGTFLSNYSYVPDVESRGYADARIAPLGPLSAEELGLWLEHLRRELPRPPAMGE